MECDRSVIEDTLGSSTGISENNIMSYLGLVEQKTNELLTIQAFLNSKVTCQPLALSHLFLTYNPTVCTSLSFISVCLTRTGSGEGLQSQRPGQIPFGSKSRASAEYQYPTCSQQVSILLILRPVYLSFICTYSRRKHGVWGWWVCLCCFLSVDYDAEESPVTDEEERPLSQEELRKKIMKGVSAIKRASDYLWSMSWSVVKSSSDLFGCDLQVLQRESSARQAATKASKVSQQFEGRRRSLDDALIWHTDLISVSSSLSAVKGSVFTTAQINGCCDRW